VETALCACPALHAGVRSPDRHGDAACLLCMLGAAYLLHAVMHIIPMRRTYHSIACWLYSLTPTAPQPGCHDTSCCQPQGHQSKSVLMHQSQLSLTFSARQNNGASNWHSVNTVNTATLLHLSPCCSDNAAADDTNKLRKGYTPVADSKEPPHRAGPLFAHSLQMHLVQHISVSCAINNHSKKTQMRCCATYGYLMQQHMP
jgi:hypothetical protein